MKRIKIFLIATLCLLIIISKNVYAASASLSTSASSVYVGDSFKVNVYMTAAAAWNVHVNSTGPVSDCVINDANATDDATNINKTFTATCKATGTGTITITLSGDITSVTDMKAVRISGTKTVTVTERPVDNRSKNNKLKSIYINGYDLVKINDHSYTLMVGNNVSDIYINAIAEDSKAIVTGVGNHSLVNGENVIEVVVTAENGDKNKITIKVTKKDGYTLNDLDTALNEDSNTVNITLSSDNKITENYINAIKSKKKFVNLNYYDGNKKLLYSWVIDGSSIDDAKAFNSAISFGSSNKQDIEEATNYAEGLIYDFKHNGSLPKGIKVKLYVGSKYSDGDVVNVYHYLSDQKELELIKDSLTVKDDYIEFDIKECSKYFVTKATITNDDGDKPLVVDTDVPATEKKDNSSLYMKIIIGLSVVVVGLVILVIILLKKKKNNKLTPDVNEQLMGVSTPVDIQNNVTAPEEQQNN